MILCRGVTGTSFLCDPGYLRCFADVGHHARVASAAPAASFKRRSDDLSWINSADKAGATLSDTPLIVSRCHFKRRNGESGRRPRKLTRARPTAGVGGPSLSRKNKGLP